MRERERDRRIEGGLKLSVHSKGSIADEARSLQVWKLLKCNIETKTSCNIVQFAQEMADLSGQIFDLYGGGGGPGVSSSESDSPISMAVVREREKKAIVFSNSAQ